MEDTFELLQGRVLPLVKIGLGRAVVPAEAKAESADKFTAKQGQA